MFPFRVFQSKQFLEQLFRAKQYYFHFTDKTTKAERGKVTDKTKWVESPSEPKHQTPEPHA